MGLRAAWSCQELGAKCCIRNASGRCVSSNCSDPTLFWPTIPAILANVSSSFSGSGEGGRNNPLCAARGRTGSADKWIFTMGAPGGCAFKSSCSSLRKTLGVQQGDRQAQGAVETLSSLRSTQDGRGRPSPRGLGNCFQGQILDSAPGLLKRARPGGRIADPAIGPAETPAVRAAPVDIPVRSLLQKPAAARPEPVIANCSRAPIVAGECLPAPGARSGRFQATRPGREDFGCPSARARPESGDRDLR